MNDGPVLILADLALDGDYGLWLRLDPCRIEDAAINEAVSNSILAYVAPVLAKSSGVSGKVTVAVDRAFVPITASGPLSLDGAMALAERRLQARPARRRADLDHRPAVPDLKLDQAMFVKVANGRVQQNGLSIPIGGNGLRVAIDGSVGFDETLDLKATIPLDRQVPGPRPEARQGRSAGPTRRRCRSGGHSPAPPSTEGPERRPPRTPPRPSARSD